MQCLCNVRNYFFLLFQMFHCHRDKMFEWKLTLCFCRLLKYVAPQSKKSKCERTRYFLQQTKPQGSFQFRDLIEVRNDGKKSEYRVERFKLVGLIASSSRQDTKLSISQRREQNQHIHKKNEVYCTIGAIITCLQCRKLD